MKKSILFIAVPLFGMMLSGCGRNGGSTQSPTAPAPEPSGQITSLPDPSVAPAPSHANSMKLTPGKPFYARVGETGLNIKAGLTPSPTDPAEYTFTWQTSDPDTVAITPSADTKSVDLEIKKVGTATVSATNEYNKTDPKFTQSVVVRCVENSRDVYFWQYDSKTDLAKFGYDKETAPNGAASGDADLAGLSWHFTRQYQNSIGSNSGAVKFGKGEGSDGNVVFSVVNERPIKKIGVETWSAHGSSTLTVKIGEESVLARKTSDEADVIETQEFETPKEGNIELNWSASEAALYIKSIIIYFDSSLEELDSISVADDSAHKVYFKSNETFSSEGLKVIAHYSHGGEDKDVSSNVVVTPPTEFTSGVKTVGVSYTEDDKVVNTSYNIIITDASATPVQAGSSVSGTVSKKVYYSGELLDISEFSASILYSDDTTVVLKCPTEHDSKFTSVPYVPMTKSLVDSGSVDLEWTYSDNGNITLNYHLSLVGFSIVGGTKYTFDLTSQASGWEGNSYVARHLASMDTVISVDFEGAKYGKVGSKEGITDESAIVQRGGIIISVNDTEHVIKSFKAEFLQWEKASGKDGKKISAYTSYYGGAYFDKTTACAVAEIASTASTKDLSIAKELELTDGIKSILLDPSSNGNNIGVMSIEVIIDDGVQAEFSNIALTTEPTTKEYAEGASFDPTGAVVTVSFTDSDKFPSLDVTEAVQWGEIDFESGTCEGTFDGKTVTVTGITKKAYVAKTYTKVTSALSDYSGTYIIGNADSKVVFNGACDNLAGATNFMTATENFDGDGNFTSSYELDQAVFTIAKSGDNYTIKAVNGTAKYLSMNKGSNASLSLNGATIKVYLGDIGASGSAGTNQKVNIVFENDRVVIKSALNPDDGYLQTAMCINASNKFTVNSLAYSVEGEDPNQEFVYDTTQFKTSANKFVDLYKMN